MSSPMLIAASIASALTIGLLHALVDSVRPALEEKHALDKVQGRRLVHLYTILSVPLLLFSGWLCDVVDVTHVLFFGSLPLAVGVSLLTQARSTLYWAILAIAAGGAGITTSGMVLMTAALFPDRGAVASLNLGFAFIGVTALVTPCLLPWLTRRIGLRQTLVPLALFCLLPATFIFLARDDVQPRGSFLVLEEVFHDSRLWLLVIPTLLYFVLDRSLDTWTKPFLAELDYKGSSLTRLLIGFWLAFLLMRIGFGWLIRPGSEVWVLLVLLVLSSMILGNLVGAYARSSGYVGYWLVGACYGPLLPGYLGVLIDFEPGRTMPTVVLGGLFALGYLSDAVLEPGLIAYSKNRPARAAMRIPMILALIMAAPTLILALVRHMR